MTLVLSYTPGGTYTGAPTLDQAVADVRQDLFDRLQNVPAGTSTRWQDDDLARALDRALDEYSFVSPLIGAVMTATLPGTRAYGYPPGAWWIESVEYPTGQWPARYVPFVEQVMPSLGTPAACSWVNGGTGGNLVGSYSWAVTFVRSGAETLLGAVGGPPLNVLGGHGIVTLPLGPPGTVGRNLYRQNPNTNQAFSLVTSILDNVTTVYSDGAADGSLGGPPPSVDGTANQQQFVLQIAPAVVPVDTSGVLSVTYASKHQLTEVGTSVPERHKDAVLLGAVAYALLAYQVPTNDLFEYQDGELRDHVDERYISAQWLAAGQRALKQYQDRLGQIRDQRNAGAAAVVTWGDVPYRWGRT